MSIPVRDQKMLWGAAASRCSFPGCAKKLVADKTLLDPAVILGEMAHVVGESDDGPRGKSLLSVDERNRYENLILLCEEHHKLIDGQPATYAIETLQRFKRDHEDRCQRAFERSLADEAAVVAPEPLVTDRLHGTLMPVLQMPRNVYTAEIAIEDFGAEKTIKQEYQSYNDGRRPPAFIVRAGRLWSFSDVGDDQGPFMRWVRPHTADGRPGPAQLLPNAAQPCVAEVRGQPRPDT